MLRWGDFIFSEDSTVFFQGGDTCAIVFIVNLDRIIFATTSSLLALVGLELISIIRACPSVL